MAIGDTHSSVRRLKDVEGIIATCDIGGFDLSSGSLGASDPCHGSATLSARALRGRWGATIEYAHTSWGRRVSRLLVRNVAGAPVGGYALIGRVMVDSGQAGFFDVAVEGDLAGALYDGICSRTCSREQGGVVNGGAFAASGYGDGSYDVSVRRDADGLIVEAVIDFM